jgi:hypothetical protein
MAFQKSRIGKAGKIVGGRIMIIRKSVLLLLVTAAGVSAMLLCYAGVKRCRAIPAQPPGDRGYQSQGKLQQGKVPKLHSKITVPADVSIELASPSNPGGPVTILVSASSKIPVGSGKLTLKVPPVGEVPAGAEVLWSDTPSDFVAETAEYTVDALPAGKYHFAAIFEFTPDRENAGKLFISKSLYLDVRPETILSSNVSFDQIKRVELWEELEQRVMMDLKADSTNVRLKTVSRDIKAAETIDPDIIASRIAELKASDPEVARSITELNRVKAAPTGDTESVERREQSQPGVMRRRVQNRPILERAVPIPERYRDL